MAKVNLTEVCDIQYGYPFDSSGFSTTPEDGMPLIRIRDVKTGCSETYFKGNFPKDYIIHKGDYLVGMDGEFNIAPWQSEDALLNQRVCKISSKCNNVSVHYIYRFLTKELKNIEDETPFVTVKHLSAKRLNQVKLDIPLLPEQERIVAELDLLTGIIDKQKAQLKELDTLAQSIFYDIILSKENIWEHKRLKEIAKFIGDGDWIESRHQSENGIRLIQTGNIGNGFFRAKDDKPHYISESTFNELGCTEIFAGDCLVSRLPEPVGRACIIPSIDCRMITAVDCTIIRLDEALLPRVFIFYSMAPSYQTQIENSTTGTTRKRISRKNLESVFIPVPPIELQQSFAQKIQSIESQKASINRSIAETQKLFDYTMDKYFG